MEYLSLTTFYNKTTYPHLTLPPPSSSQCNFLTFQLILRVKPSTHMHIILFTQIRVNSCCSALRFFFPYLVSKELPSIGAESIAWPSI